MAVDCLPLDSILKKWLRFASDDRALILATLGFSSAHVDMLNGRPMSPQTLWYKQDMIGTINEKLQSSKEAVSNSNIGAVVMLASMEVSGSYRRICSK